MNAEVSCVGILHFGDLGSAIGRLLQQSKKEIRLVTCAAGRSSKTSERAAGLSVEDLGSLDKVLEVADIVLSVVVPDAALSVAKECAERVCLAKTECLFVDMNSTGISDIQQIQHAVESAGLRFANATVHGGTKHLEEMGVVYASGTFRAEVVRLYAGLLRVEDLGDDVLLASQMKLLMGAQSKCLNVLFLEVALLASRLGLLDDFLAEQEAFYPAMYNAIERMLPTYPDHASRRVSELNGVVDLAQLAGNGGEVFQVMRDRLLNAADRWTADGDLTGTLKSTIKRIADSDRLSNEKE